MTRSRKLVVVINALAFIAALVWLVSAPSLEPAVAALTLLATLAGLFVIERAARRSSSRQAGDVYMSANVSAGAGFDGRGGDAKIEGGTGYRGASGGNVTIGPGTYAAGDGGPGGSGGDLNIKGGDAK